MAKTIKRGSYAWNYFEKDPIGMFATYLKCRKRYKTSGNTSNLLDHLKRAHNITNICANDGDTSSGSDDEAGVKPKRKIFKQQSLTKCVKSLEAYKKNDKRQNELDK